MNKPLTMAIKETKLNLAKVCNESGLSPVILDLIMQGIYSEVHSLADKQATEEEIAYTTMIKNQDDNDCDVNLEGGLSESE